MTPGTKVCLHCPLSEVICETSQDNEFFLKALVNPPRCLRDYAIWRLRLTPMKALEKADGIVSSVIVLVKGEPEIDVEAYKVELLKLARGEGWPKARWERESINEQSAA